MADPRDETMLGADAEMAAEEAAAMEPEEAMMAEEGAEMAGEEAAPMVHTADEIPELAGLEIGDTITFSVVNIQDDGTYELAPVSEEVPPEVAEGAEMGAEAGAELGAELGAGAGAEAGAEQANREAIAEELL